jgi:cytochrome c oxidase subunit 2
MTDWMNMPTLATKHGAAIDTMNGVIHILMAVLFVGWGAFFVYTLFRFRKSAHPVADHHGVTSHTSTYLEIGVAVAEAVLLFGFSVPLWIKWVDKPPAPGEALTVQVTGEQFAWNIHYPGPDGKFGRQSTDKIDMQTNPLGLDRSDPDAKDDVITLNQLHLPVNKPVIVRLRSKDVIHSFNVPEFRVKQDAVPGLTIPIWFTPTITTEEMRQKTGNPEFTYEIACAQLCGLGHYRMRGFVTVESQEEFTKWFDAEEAKSAEESSDVWSN